MIEDLANTIVTGCVMLVVLCKILRKPCPSLKQMDLLEYWRL